LRRVSEHIYLLDTYALGFVEFVAAYLVVGSESSALVDIGYASSLPRVFEELGEAGLKPTDVNYVVPTHLHLDHAGGASQFIKNSKKSIILCHPRAVKHFLDPSKLNASVREFYGDLASSFGLVEPIPLENIRSVQEYERIDMGDASLRFIYAPGHAPHQIAVYVEEDQALITGDAVSIDLPSFPSRIPTTPPPSYNHLEAIETLMKLSKLKAKIILRPHFGETAWSQDYFDEEISLLESWKENVEEYLKKGSAIDDAVEEIVNQYSRKFKNKITTVPFYLYTTIKLSYLGMEKYLREQR
jgi:glyoxylase-like metal-dependent hydrolase (beta-lactamase superfamily II)